MEHDIDLVGYLEGVLSREEANKIQTHLENCPECSREFDFLKKSDRLFKSVYQKKTSFQCPETSSLIQFVLDESSPHDKGKLEKHLATCGGCREKAGFLWEALGFEAKIPSPDRFNPLPDDLKSRISSKPEDLPSETSPTSTIAPFPEQVWKKDAGILHADDVFEEDDSLYHQPLAAASSEFMDKKHGTEGEAYGVAVGTSAGGGEVLKVLAWVGNTEREKGELTVVGSEPRSKIVTPLEKLEKRLRQRFQSVPMLASLKLYNRDVHVEIEMDGSELKDRRLLKYLDEAKSLLLTVIVAVVKAACGISGPDKYVYSGDVSFVGELKAIGRVEEKAEVVLSKGYKLVASQKNKDDIPHVVHGSHAKDLMFFDNLDDLAEDLYGIRKRKGETDIDVGVLPDETGAFKFIQVFLSILALAYLIGAVITRDLFFLAHLMMAFHLKHESGLMFSYALLMKLGFVIIISSCASALISNASKKLRPSTAGSVGKALKNGSLGFLFFCSVIFSVFIGLLYVKPDRFQRYETIEYLKDKPFFGVMVKNVPNIRYQRFMELSAGENRDNLKAAVEIGLKISPLDEKFGSAFLEMVTILMDKVNNRENARDLIYNYMDYVDSLRGTSGAREAVYDTIFSAMDIIEKYKLGGDDRDSISLEGFVAKAMMEYEIGK